MAFVRLLLLSDIHANLTALQAVMEDAERRRYDQIVHLGDALGYGPHPHDVLEVLRDLDAKCIVGNHDQMLLEYADGTRPYKESTVASVLKWQLGRLTERDLRWVRDWRDGSDYPDVGARYRHGTPTSLDEYMDSVPAARDAFAQWQGMLAFVGHTHVPAVYATLNAPVGDWIKGHTLSDTTTYLVPPRARVILNPGSVGQPRDHDPRASYAIFDTARSAFEVFRVPYDVARTQAAIREAGLPEVLAARLAVGK